MWLLWGYLSFMTRGSEVIASISELWAKQYYCSASAFSSSIRFSMSLGQLQASCPHTIVLKSRRGWEWMGDGHWVLFCMLVNWTPIKKNETEQRTQKGTPSSIGNYSSKSKKKYLMKKYTSKNRSEKYWTATCIRVKVDHSATPCKKIILK